MRKSPFLVAALLVASLAACREFDGKIVTIAGPFGADLGGTWTLESINDTLPFTTATAATAAPCSSASPCRNEIQAGILNIEYTNEKKWDSRIWYTRTRNLTGVVAFERDSVKRGVWYSSTTDGENYLSLQIDFPTTNLYLGKASADLKTITTSGIVGVGVVSEAQTWVWRKNE